MIKKYNVVWTMVDSVRRYKTQGDDRSRLKAMDDFAKEAVEFKNCVTSAPSTVMSVSASMTSLPASHLGRNYDDFQFDNGYFATLPGILKNNGWETRRSFIMHRQIREKLRQFELVEKKYWPNDFSHSKWWCNDDINRLIHNTLDKDRDRTKPQFWFIDYNCRKDEYMSEIVQNTLDSLKDAGFTEDNTVFVLCSDHGYPDPSRGITPEYLSQKKLTHDIFMTDDNIMIPMILKYPGCKKGQKIQDVVSSLDLMPTILNILGISVSNDVSSRFHGINLLPLLNGKGGDIYKDRKIRSDARFIYQPGRVTALRGQNYKYVLHQDDMHEEFVFVGDNEIDEPSVINSSNEEVQRALLDFRKSFELSEKKASEAQQEYAAYQLSQKIILASKKYEGDISILLVGEISEFLVSSIEKELLKNLSENRIRVTFLKDLSNIPEDSFTIAAIFRKKYSSLKGENRIKAKAKLSLDAESLTSISNTQKNRVLRFFEHFKLIWRNIDFYVNEPYLFLYEPYEIFKRVFRIDYDYTQKKWTPRKYKK